MKTTSNKTNKICVKWLFVSMFALASMSVMGQTTADTIRFQYQVGDTVIIKKDCQRYLTGERMSTWVYYVSHPILQVGTNRFPNGVLLSGILSWVDPSGLVLQSASARRDSISQAIAEQQQADAAQEVAERAQETEDLNELQKALIEHQANAHGSGTIQADTTVQVRIDSMVAVTPADTLLPAEPTETEPAFVINAQPVEKNYQRFSIGLRGGAASLMHKTTNGKWNCGFDALLDLQYAYYWTKFGRAYDLGIVTGLSAGYMQSGMGLRVNDQFTVNTSGGPIDYTLSAERIKENDGQIQIEIPLLFSLVMKNGFFFNAGPRFILPVYTPYKQTIINPNVDAYFQQEGVHVTNEVITGMVTDEQLASKGTNANQFKVNITLSAELGYEWQLKHKNAFGLGVYANYGLWNAFKNTTGDQSLISVPPPADSPASVDILSATDTYASKLGYFDAGVKLVYHFNFQDTK